MGLFDIFKKRKEKEKNKVTNVEEKSNKDEQNEVTNNSDDIQQKNAVNSEENEPDNNVEEKLDTDEQNDDTNDSDDTQQEVSVNSEENESDNNVEEKVNTDEEPDDGNDSVNTQQEISLNSEENESDNNVKEKVNTDEQNDSEDSKEKSYEKGLAKSSSSFGQKLNKIFSKFRTINEDFFEELEDTLIESDVGFETSMQIVDSLKEEVKLKNVKKTNDVQNVIVQKMIEIYEENNSDDNISISESKNGPTVILFTGVNGVGKTTTIGKMANQYHKNGKKVLLAAADTFRAGAIEQLNEWAIRDNVGIVKKEEKSDPASVVYEAINKAKKENYDTLFIDTAGRLQNKVNLMNELSKINKIIKREIPDAPHETLLVLDATTGQNAISQVKLFNEVTNISGIVLTKLDGTAKGGIIFAIRNEMKIPVKLVGLGEKVDDLKEFDANDFIYGLFKDLFIVE
ncbi:signal recognition particle-docking protein FtsY [Lactobacillus sp. S2-2]|uniref:signal recognition particle-docking protein FtsY n=1 Tax=Lactobacillus sp. S2-2 TaxID=2692917 RepID=UPI001EFFD201|nr:signal recognition particle-docking protein FtsY [Lactobacillus sp. S2-2]MCF6515086.1 signal recognition particle-docking protein FtsY [Lactobacillus sp. S2-2]